ncbi:MAG: hypothetical protein CME61_01675 [Halobacteriovoraceae bacterium]|nr:hypothetical protein [Halobacteriovoraceae bacterium]|tara:strand:+ start:375 stop:899 length:525 start_codon:yes stop_codon:yes gene_type:complete
MKIFILISLLLCFCSVAHEHKIHDSSKKSANGVRKIVGPDLKSSLIEILKADELLHESFFKYDAEAVEKNAKALATIVDSVKDKKIKKIFKKTSKQLLKIKASEEKDKNYHSYGLVSKTLVEILKKYDLGVDYNIYYCPMLKKSWVQNSKKKNKVHNPYAGDYMPHCGVKTTNF